MQKENAPPRQESVKESIAPTQYDARVLIGGDQHIPYHDDKVFQLFEQLIKDQVKVDPGEAFELVLSGDLIDCYHLSKFQKHPVIQHRIDNELEIARSYLKDWRMLVGSRKITALEGNHEFRLRSSIVTKLPEIMTIVPTIPDLLGCKELDINWIGVDEHATSWDSVFYNWNDVLIGHFKKVSKHAGYTAKNLIDEWGVSVVQAHIHRMGMHARSFHDKTIFGIEGGCMCSLEPNYMIHANWQHGLVMLTLKDGIVYPEIINIHDGSMWYGGKFYEV